MTLTELRYAVALAREGHFGRAAESCCVSQPTLSHGIRRLEDELGLQLFERRPREISVTTAGRAVIEQARQTLEAAERVRSVAQAAGDVMAGELRVGAIFTVGPYLLPDLIPRLRELAPEMPLLLEENYTATLARRLLEGQLDCALISQPFSENGIEVLDLYTEGFSVLAPPDHALAAGESIDGGDLEGESVLLLGDGHCFRDQVLSACPECRPSANQHARIVEGTSLETIRQMVMSGLGISVFPDTALAGEERPLTAVRPFRGPSPRRTISVAWRRGYPREAAVRALAQAIRDRPPPGAHPLHPETAATAVD